MNNMNISLIMQKHFVKGGKTKKSQPTKSKSKAKKVLPELNGFMSSTSEEDNIPLSRRSEVISGDAPVTKTKKDTTPKSNKSTVKRSKNFQKTTLTLFDSSSNDSFNLDASVVEPATDISLHPETISSEKAIVAKGKSSKKGAKKTSVTDAGKIYFT
jgi:predicted transcriptional regulator